MVFTIKSKKQKTNKQTKNPFSSKSVQFSGNINWFSLLHRFNSSLTEFTKIYWTLASFNTIVLFSA